MGNNIDLTNKDIIKIKSKEAQIIGLFKDKILDIQSVYRELYETIGKALSEIQTQREEEEFEQMKNIDLCKALKGTEYMTRFTKLCDIKQLITYIETGFATLKCDYCSEKASIVDEGDEEPPSKLYCETHFELFGSKSKPPTNLMHSLNFNKILLRELEFQLIRLQERISFFETKNDKKEQSLYKEVKLLIDKNFEELKNLLMSMSFKCFKINMHKENKEDDNYKLNYESFLFIKNECDKCRNTIFKILSMIPEVCDKIERDSLIQGIVDFI